MDTIKGVADYIEKILGDKHYCFCWEELKKSIPKTDTALRNELSRLVKKKEIIGLRSGFYLILSREFKHNDKVPIELYVDKLFNYLNRPYYVALYSASLLYRAGYQQPDGDFIVTQPPYIRDIKKGLTHLNIFTSDTWPSKNIIEKKSNSKYINISSPALTAIDLIRFQSKLGGINRILPRLEELAPQINPNDIEDLLTWYPHVSTIQRLGYLLTEVKADFRLRELLQDYLKRNRYYPVLLSIGDNKKPGEAPNSWKVDVNLTLVDDL